MDHQSRPVNAHKAYHAHVYFDEHTQQSAKDLCSQVASRFGLQVGRFHQRLVGPHPMWSCQITFGRKDFEALIPWLETHRQGLTILIHGLTGNDLRDHTEFAYWLGEPQALDLTQFDTAATTQG